MTYRNKSIMGKKVTFEEAKHITAKVIELLEQKSMIKLPMDNIIFNPLGDIPLLEMMLNLNIVTKEYVNGTVYDKKNFQMAMRIVGGKLLSKCKDGKERPDVYAWQISKVLKAKNKRNIGFHTVEGAQCYAEVLDTIANQQERDLFTQLLINCPKDLLMVHTDAETRKVMVVTEELIRKYGINEVPNSYAIEWPEEGADGVELTPIEVGDALVLETCSFGPAFYVVQKEMYENTHQEIECK